MARDFGSLLFTKVYETKRIKKTLTTFYISFVNIDHFSLVSQRTWAKLLL